MQGRTLVLRSRAWASAGLAAAVGLASFGHAVNVTLGPPFPRTSPDHGTALDIAGQGIADAGSMVEAIVQCARIVARLGATSEGTREGAAGAA